MTQQMGVNEALQTDYARLDPKYAAMLSQFRHKTPVHAYLLTGAAGIGKMTYARFCASALYCEADEGERPCGVCPGCLRMASDQNPDVTALVGDGGSLKVDDVRQVLDAISQFSFGSGYRVVLIEPVEKLTKEAQNCLLKSLEEPPSQVVFLLMSHDASAVLPTIVSRCLRVPMRPWTDERIIEALTKRGCPREDALQAALLAGGNIGSALQHLKNQSEDAAAHSFAMEALGIASDAAAVRLSTRLKEDKAGASAYLDALEGAISTAIRVCVGQLPEGVLASYPAAWRGEAVHHRLDSLLRLITAVEQTKKERAGQVNWQANIDLLMMKILEEIKQWQ